VRRYNPLVLFMIVVTVTMWYCTKRPMRCDHFLIYCIPHLNSYHSPFIQPSFLLWFATETPSSIAGRNWARYVRRILSTIISVHTSRAFKQVLKSHYVGLMALLHPRTKSCYGFLLPLKINRSRPGLKPRNFGAMSSTITITPPISTLFKIICVYFSDCSLLNTFYVFLCFFLCFFHS
jgi:hypothetical protein